MYLQCLAKVPNQRMQRNGSNCYGCAYSLSPSADTQAVMRPKLTVRAISVGATLRFEENGGGNTPR
jgi:hypothetical protein